MSSKYSRSVNKYGKHSYSSRSRSSNESTDKKYSFSKSTYTSTAVDSGDLLGKYSRGTDRASATAVSKDELNKYSRKVSSKSYPSLYRKRARRRRILISAVIVMVALLAGGCAAAFGYVSWLNGQFRSGIENFDELKSALATDAEEGDPFYILLMGTDGRNDEEADRTDTIILARVDTSAQQVVLISIPRDTMIELDGVGTAKINAAHAYYGPAGAVEAVEEFAGVQISHYAEIDFSGFVDLVDALGGVEVDVPIEIDDEDAGGYVAQGLQVLDGEHALIFCRSRDTAIGDYQRQANQRIFLQALASEILSSDVATLTASINSISSAVSTDMTADEILSIAMSLKGMDTSSIYSYTVPSTTSTVDGVSYVVAYDDEWAEMMEIIDSGGIPDEQSWEIAGIVSEEYSNSTETTTTSQSSSITRSSYSVTVRNGGGIEGSASNAASVLEDAGYSIYETGNANQFVYEQTLIIYDDDEYSSIASDIMYILGTGTVVQSSGRYSFDSDILVMLGSDWTG